MAEPMGFLEPNLMNITEIIVGDRVLIQSDADTREVAEIKAILDNGKIVVKLSNNKMMSIIPYYIIKSFGQ